MARCRTSRPCDRHIGCHPVGGRVGRDQPQVTEAHVGQRARRRADIARSLGSDQHKRELFCHLHSASIIACRGSRQRRDTAVWAIVRLDGASAAGDEFDSVERPSL